MAFGKGPLVDLSFLKDLGLTQGELKVYLALLERESCTAGAASKLSRVHTSKVYPILDRLIQKGLASYLVRDGMRHYSSTGPHRLMGLIQKKRQDLERQEEAVKEIIPQMLAGQRLASPQSAAVFEGIGGVKAAFEMLLDDWERGDSYLAFAPDMDIGNEEFNKFFRKHNLQRMEIGVAIRIIAMKSRRTLYERDFSDAANIEFRYTEFSLPVATTIVRSKVATLVWGRQPTAFVIDSGFVADRYREFFEKIWKIAEE